MEHGNSFSHNSHAAKSSSDSNPLEAENSSTNSEAPSNPNNDDARIEEPPVEPDPNLVVQEEMQGYSNPLEAGNSSKNSEADPSNPNNDGAIVDVLPIANVTRIMRKVLPPRARITEEAKEVIQQCLSEFILFITGEANEQTQQESLTTLTAENLLSAMNTLGFHQYIGPLTLFLQRYRANNG